MERYCEYTEEKEFIEGDSRGDNFVEFCDQQGECHRCTEDYVSVETDVRVEEDCERILRQRNERECNFAI